MIDLSNGVLLFIEPSSPASDKPVIDSLTRKMAASLRTARDPGYTSYGVHDCVCGASSTSHDFILSTGLTTNSLCVHYLAHHRDDVPSGELHKVAQLDDGETTPTDEELMPPNYELQELKMLEQHRREFPDCQPSTDDEVALVVESRKAWWLKAVLAMALVLLAAVTFNLLDW